MTEDSSKQQKLTNHRAVRKVCSQDRNGMLMNKITVEMQTNAEALQLKLKLKLKLKIILMEIKCHIDVV